MIEQTRGCFDDLVVGTTTRSPRRTVTEADVVGFAGMSGDFNALHTDEVAASATPFGTRIAHGLLGAAIASGLFTRTALSASLQESLIALLGVDCRFVNPLRIGDTVHVEAEITELRPTSDSSRGVVVVERRLVNHEGAVVQVITTPMLIHTTRPDQGDTPT
ncbi:MaoC/PaaZ C-terminal domain-containing protein [Prauserella muralis]|uniref:Acyl dehydratase n=1 Tax=Prauserella muralis TaxID=588067 RepID=A0A2V4AEU6_9PSEU|nr:MaoC/PaaZ C-terminal domain-containing protein [Prauserella muralis]PXY16527.1 acyl dehydratase [Prauserella muralis]TWE11233.1 acyl dehydratase [Prauserella muralis]